MKYLITITFSILSTFFCRSQPTENTIAAFPVDTIYLELKDKLSFEAQPDSAGVLHFRKVKKKGDPTTTVSIDVSFSEGMGTLLKIENPFDGDLTYKAELYSYKTKNYVETSTIPIMAKLSSFETWPYKIDKMRLTGFLLKKAG